MRKWQHYSMKELKVIEDNYKVMSDEQIASMLNRTPRGINKTRVKYGWTQVHTFNRINKKYQISREISQLNKFNFKGAISDIVNQRIAYLETLDRVEKRHIRTSTAIQAKVYEMHIKGKFNYQIAEKFKIEVKKVSKILRLVNPKVTDPITITLQSKI